MYSASPPFQYPSTPVAATTQAHHRRKSQYKALTPNTPTRIFSNSRRSSVGGSGGGGGGYHYITTPSRSDSPKLSLRNRFKARCFERAAKAREKAIKGKRYANHQRQLSSGDDFFMDDDEEDDDDDEEDEDIMQDEIFRRIMANATRKERHSYKLSYAQEVGSSIDPDLEDVARWEQELAVSDPTIPSHRTTTATTRPVQGEEEELTPIDLDDEELAAYAEECAALADFDDIPEEELFSWSDLEEPDEHGYDMDVA